jgi:hypothetical protein
LPDYFRLLSCQFMGTQARRLSVLHASAGGRRVLRSRA